jgi:hypothetical protein
MKKAFLCIVSSLLLFSSSIVAQKKDRIEYLPNFDKKQLHFGYYLGLNQKTFKVSYNSFLSDLNLDDDNYLKVEESMGFNIGLIVDYKLHDNINLRFEPGLSSNTKTLTYNYLNEEREVPGTYLRMPLLLKFSTNRLDNMRAFVIGGVSYDFNFSSNEKNVNDNSQGEFRMKKSNFMYEVGVGVDIYLFYFKFSPSIRGIFAINNEIIPDSSYGEPYTGPYTGVIDYFGTRGVFINFTFE